MVYIIRNDDEIVYVGETKNIRERMCNLKNTKNHSVRRNIGHKIFNNEPNFKKATAFNGFNPDKENRLNEWICKNLTISFVELDLGRKELEEIFTSKKEKPLYNRR